MASNRTFIFKTVVSLTSPLATQVDKEYDLHGKVVMSGAIDMHTHIGGGKGNIARTLLPEDHRQDPVDTHATLPVPAAVTPCPVPLSPVIVMRKWAIPPALNLPYYRLMPVRHTWKWRDIPILDKGGYVMLGSDDYLLRMLTAKKDQKAINDYVAWTMQCRQSHWR